MPALEYESPDLGMRQLALIPMPLEDRPTVSIARGRKPTLAERAFEALGRELRGVAGALSEATEAIDDAERRAGVRGPWRESHLLREGEEVIRSKRLND